MLLLCAAVLLAALWGIIGMISALRRPAYTFADWQKASERICRATLRLNSAACSSKGRGFRRSTCRVLLQDLLANTGFILAFAHGARQHFHQPERLCCARDVLTRAVSLRLLLYWSRLEFCFWPPSSNVSHQRALAATNSYISLCLVWAAFLEHCVY